MYKSGGVLLNKKMDKVLLVIRKENEYSFPKGHLEEGESLIEAAIRETTEESGRDVKLLLEEPIGCMRYTHKVEGPVENYMYLFIDKGKAKGEIKEADKERSKWIKLEDVEDILSYEDLKEFWREVYPIIKNEKLKMNKD